MRSIVSGSSFIFFRFEISLEERIQVVRLIIHLRAYIEEVISARKCCTINGAQSSFPRLLRKLSREDFEDEDDDFFLSKGLFLLFFDENSKRVFFAEEQEEDSPRESRDRFCVCRSCMCAKEDEDEERRIRCRCPCWRQKLLFRDDDEEFTTLYNLVELLRDEERFR